MIRQNLIALQDKPDEAALKAAFKSFRLFHEATTGLYYLMPFDGPDPKRPEFGGYYHQFFPGNKRVDLSAFDAFVAAGVAADQFEKHQADRGVVRQAILLSKTLKTRVLCAYGDDEDTDIAAVAKDGMLEYLRFKALPVTTPADTPESHQRLREAHAAGSQDITIKGLADDPEPTQTETYMAGTYTPGAGYALEPYGQTLSGMVDADTAITLVLEEVPSGTHINLLFRNAELAFKHAFGRPAPNLFDFGLPIPTGKALKQIADGRGVSTDELIKSHGEFTLLYGAGRPTPPILEKAGKALKLGIVILLMPVIMIYMAIYEWMERRKGRS
ncbi:MAG: hypothetical protein AAFX86_12480 [Pseudomonadota bacterium]